MMLSEHEEGRALVRQMAEAAAEYRQGVADAGQRWAAAAKQYIALLREHIAKENNILFVMAERMLTPEEQGTLATSFEKVEIERMGAGTHERLHAQMDQLLASIWKERITSR